MKGLGSYKYITEHPEFFNRKKLLDRDCCKEIHAKVEAGKPLLFLPNTFHDISVKWDYNLVIFGILESGLKSALVIKDIDLYFDVRVPDKLEAMELVEAIKDLYEIQFPRQFKPLRFSVVKHFPAKGFCEEPVDYVRYHFDNNMTRRNVIQMLGKGISVSDGIGGKQFFALETAFDDVQASVVLKIIREYGIESAKWNRIENYKRITDENPYVLREKVPYIFEISIKNIHEHKFDVFAPENANLRFDKSLVCGWDLETFRKITTGGAPPIASVLRDYSRIEEFKFEKNSKNLDAICFCACLAFSHPHSKEPLARIAITTMPCLKIPGVMIIKCSSQAQIFLAMALVIGRFSPEFLVGFNCGGYDAHFVSNRLAVYDSKWKTSLMEQYTRLLLPVPGSPAWFGHTQKNVAFKDFEIKIEADVYYKALLHGIPGIISCDSRCIFMQMFPKAESSSLNMFLKIAGLRGKEDMAIFTMNRIYILVKKIEKHLVAIGEQPEAGDPQRMFAAIIEHIKSVIEINGEQHVMFPIKPERNGYLNYALHKLSALEILHLIGGEEYGGKSNEGVWQIINYCNWDAFLPLELLRSKSVITDKREIASMSHTSIPTAFYKANGIKVLNCFMYHAHKPEWNLALGVSSKYGGFIDREKKYPGGYVLPPIKGLKRDHAINKLARLNAHVNGKRTDALSSTSNPQSPDFDDELLQSNEFWNKVSSFKKALANRSIKLHEIPSEFKSAVLDNSKKAIEDHIITDRPSSDFDFSSLYPSLMMTYNISPEKTVIESEIPKMQQRHEVKIRRFPFDYPTLEESKKHIVTGGMVQHAHPLRGKMLEMRKSLKQAHGKNWKAFIDQDFCKSTLNEYRNTTLEDWRKYGMGLLPWILMQFFDMRSGVKQEMEKYLEPKEFLNSHIDYLKTFWNSDLPQKPKVYELLEKEIQQRTLEFTADPRPYYQARINVMLRVQEFLQTHWQEQNLEEVFEMVCERASYYNVKQNSIKVFMNTFYGETGNQISAIFMIEIAGYVTMSGQANIKKVRDYLFSNKFDIDYGDTDSLYITPVDDWFAECDKNYLAGKIDKAQYWTEMINITMKVMDNMRSKVNNMLLASNTAAFLKMAYEEVLFPVVFLGKKKNIGVKHEGIPNVKACMPGYDLQEFMKGRSLHVRGLEIVKRGSSEFLKEMCYGIFKDAFCITETRSLQEIVNDALTVVKFKTWEPSNFIKSAAYKLAGAGKPGNVAVLSFIERMKNVESEHPECGIKVPEVGERFKYVITKAYPWKYNQKGNQVEISTSDKYELFDSLANEMYNKIIRPLEIDIDYYIMNELIGQLSRFVLYHTDFDKYDTNNDADYKAADKAAHESAKKMLRNYYKENFASKYVNIGKVHKALYKKLYANKGVVTKLVQEDGVVEIVESFEKDAEKLGAKLARPLSSRTILESQYGKLFIKSASRLYAQQMPKLKREKNQCYENIKIARQALIDYMPKIMGFVNAQKQQTSKMIEDFNRDNVGNLSEITDEDMKALVEKAKNFQSVESEIPTDELMDLQCNLVNAYKKLKECLLFEQDVKDAGYGQTSSSTIKSLESRFSEHIFQTCGYKF